MDTQQNTPDSETGGADATFCATEGVVCFDPAEIATGVSPTEGGVGTLTPPVTAQDRRIGPENAPLLLVEYGDYQCPACRDVYPIIEQLRQSLSNDLCFVFRHFPLTQIHQYAQRAAEATECAEAQGRFWQMHECLYHRLPILDEAGVVQCAQMMGLDVTRFLRDMAGHRYADAVRQNVESGLQSGVSGTPTFFINGVRYEGDLTHEALEAALQRTLQTLLTVPEEKR